MHGLSAVDHVMLRSLDLRPGHRVVDFACGTGDPAFAIARWVSPRGEVVGLDIATPMLAIAKRRARLLDVRNVRFRVANMEDYVHRGRRFDRAASRFGLMFAHDVTRALERMRDSLKPGGRIAIAAWGPAKDNPASVLRAEATRPFRAQPPPDPETSPHPLRLGRPALLPRLLRDAGFRGVAVEAVRLYTTHADLEVAVRMQRETAMADLYSSLSEADRERLTDRLRRGLAHFREGEIIRLPAMAWVAWGRK